MIAPAPKAPCGHVGEVVVGTYVRCLQGCEGGAAKTGGRLGEPGHVEACACRRCRIRRAATTIVVRSREGKDVVRVPWDGTAESVTWSPKEDADARNWMLLDAEGAVLASGHTPPIRVERGSPYTSHLGPMLDTVAKFTIARDHATEYQKVMDQRREFEADLDRRISKALNAALTCLEASAVRFPKERSMSVLATVARRGYVTAGGTDEEAGTMQLHRHEHSYATTFSLEVTRAGRYWAGRTTVPMR